MTFSKNGAALAVLAVEFILTSLGIEFEVGSVERVINAVVVIVAFAMMVRNQMDRIDVKGFFLKK